MRRIPIIVLTGLVLAISGCKKAGEEELSGSSPSGSDSGNTPVGIVDNEAGFYVKVIPNSRYAYKVHAAGTTSTPCTANSTPGTNDIGCMVEAMELDLVFNGATLQYNVPSSMCSYLIFTPYYYFYKESSPGPVAVHYRIPQSGAGTIVSQVDGSGNPTTTAYSSGTSIGCVYDYTTVEGPNCCTGSYTLTKDTETDPGVWETEVSIVPWGGKAANCLAGPAMDTQPKSKSGYPKSDIIYVEGTGLNKSYEIKSPLDVNRGIHYVANYFNTADHADVGGLPVAMQAPGSVGTSIVPAVAGTSPYYEFLCVDRAFEVISRIQVSIQEWNTKAQFDLFGSGGDADLVPGTGVETGFPGLPINFYNDFWDWKDHRVIPWVSGAREYFPGT
jgi:hypothetical protein